eukprot:15355886-Ditylum_brightwellii.AAC.1
MTEVAKKGVWASVFLKLHTPLTWNLMCHSDSTKNVKGFESLLTKYENEVRQHGYELYELGTHSIHKGASMYASSGSTAGPGGISICIRGEWTMGKVQDTYMLYKKAGDQYIGRILSGLPVMSHLFARSHPQFTCLKSGDEDESNFTSCQNTLRGQVSDTITLIFP